MTQLFYSDTKFENLTQNSNLTQKFSLSFINIKLNAYCNHAFLIDLTPNEILFGVKSIGKVHFPIDLAPVTSNQSEKCIFPIDLAPNGILVNRKSVITIEIWLDLTCIRINLSTCTFTSSQWGNIHVYNQVIYNVTRQA